MLYVVNRYRILSTKPEETLPLLREIEGASYLKATAVVNNCTSAWIRRLRRCGPPWALPRIGAAVRPAASVFDSSGFCGRGRKRPRAKVVRRYVHFVWEDEADF